MLLGSARISAKEGSGVTSIPLSKFWSVRAPFLPAAGSPVVPAEEGVGTVRVKAPSLCDTTDAKAAPIYLSEEQHL